MHESWGHHLYAGQPWSNPFEALDIAKQTGDTKPNIEFVLPAADQIEWSAEPFEALTDLYTKRARALREQFDYLIALYSGGSDSHQMLMTFLNAGIHLDEVVTCYPTNWADKLTGDPSPDDPLGLLYEYRHAALPGFREVHLRSPGTRLTIIDTTGAYAGDMDEWQAGLFGSRMSGGLHGLYQAVRRVRVATCLQNLAAEKNVRVGVLIGADKPPLKLLGAELYIQFSDAGRVGIEHFWQHGTDLRYEPVMFYWGDLRITCKQAHVIKRVLEVNPRLISDVDAHRRAIYPDWTPQYQRREAVCGDVLTTCVGERAAAIAAERTRYYNQRFAGLCGIGRMINEEPKLGHGARVLLLTRKTQSYRIGSLSCASLLDGS